MQLNDINLYRIRSQPSYHDLNYEIDEDGKIFVMPSYSNQHFTKGISHFVPLSPEIFIRLYKSYSAFKTIGYSTTMPTKLDQTGLVYEKIGLLPSEVNDKNTIGWDHYAIYPSTKVSWDDFLNKLNTSYLNQADPFLIDAGYDSNSTASWEWKAAYPSDAKLTVLSTLFFEMAQSQSIDPNHALRYLHLHYSLLNEGVKYEDFCRGDVLTNLLVESLQQCQDAPYFDMEAARDEIRSDLMGIFPSVSIPLRSYPSTSDEVVD